MPSPEPAPAGDTPHTHALEVMVLDLLKPMLRQWLDENMPRLVAEALSEEASAPAIQGRRQEDLKTGAPGLKHRHRPLHPQQPVSVEPVHAREDLPARRHRGAHPRRLDEGRRLQGRPAGARQGRALLHRHPAAQRDGLAAHGACAQQHAAGRAVPLRAHARQGRAVAAGHGPRRHRHAARRRAADDGAAGARPPQDRPREVPREGVGVEGRERRHHRQPAEAAGRLVRLEPRALHDGRGPVEGRPQGVRRSLQRRA